MVSALKALIYDATETLDFYQQTLAKSLQAKRHKREIKAIHEYQGAVKRLRDPVALMCNRMKHEFREIIAGHIVSQIDGSLTCVYRMNVALDGIQKPDADVHKHSGFSSFDRTFHEVIHGLLRADYRAGELVNGLSDNQVEPIMMKGPSALGLARVLDGLGRTRPLVASSEPKQFNGVQAVGDEVHLIRVAADSVSEPTQRTIHITVDEAALGAELFT